MTFSRHILCIRWCVILSTLLSLGYCVPTVVAVDSTCENLDVFASAGIVEPIPGDDLRYCSNSKSQCCTDAYFAYLKEILIAELSTGAVVDLQPVLTLWKQTFNLSQATLDEFLVDFFENFPLPDEFRNLLEDYLKSQEEELRSQLSPDFDVNLDYDFKGFVENLTIVLVEMFATFLPQVDPSVTASKALCVRDLLIDHIASIGDVLLQIESHLAQLQLVYQTMHKINIYLDSINSTSVFNYRPSEQCVSAIIDQTCASCSQNIPLLCESVCGPVIAGCQAPLRDSLTGQFDALWNVAGQVANLAHNYINQTLRVELPQILSSTVLISDVNPRSVDVCGVNLVVILTNENEKRFVPTISLPDSLDPWLSHSALLRGILTYDPVPAFCDSRSSPLDCWNGTHTLSNGSVSTVQLGMGICDQKPGEPFDVRQLYEQAVAIGTPVTDFLMTDNLLQTLPQGVTVPTVPPMKPPPTTPPTTLINPEEETSGSTTLSPAPWLAWTTLTVLVLVALILR